MRISVFGAGYVGLVQAAALAEVGNHVVCVDVDADRIARLNRGRIPIYEPGLEPLVRENRDAGRLRFTVDPVEAVAHGEVIFIAVGTPPDEDGSADLRHVLAVAETIGAHMDGHKIVVSKSTVPVGTGAEVRSRLAEMLARRDRRELTFDIVSNPEFLKEGSAVADCMRPDRIVIGTDSDAAEQVLRELYAPFNRTHDKVIVMDVRSAELTKYAANCMLATKITFMNEMAHLADALGADIEMVRQGLGSDPRIGYHFIYPGVGYGGSCFPKDVKAMIHAAGDIGVDAGILKAVETRNARQKTALIEKMRQHLGDLAGRTVALWGLAFKPETDDMREAPSRALMEALWDAGAGIRAYDPEAMGECRRLYGDRDGLTLCDSKEAALEGADVLAIVTDWKAFRAPDYDAIRTALKVPAVFDGRNLYTPATMARHGLYYYCIGRPVVAPA